MANHKNRFEEHLDRLNEDRLLAEDLKGKLIEAVLELGDVKRTHTSRQKELVEKEIEAAKLESQNQDLKASLMRSFIEREDLENRKRFLLMNIDKVNSQIQNLDNNSGLALCSDRVKTFCERNSANHQLTLINKIAEAKHKLIKYGFFV